MRWPRRVHRWRGAQGLRRLSQGLGRLWPWWWLVPALVLAMALGWWTGARAAAGRGDRQAAGDPGGTGGAAAAEAPGAGPAVPALAPLPPAKPPQPASRGGAPGHRTGGRPGETHVVRQGETLYGIARQYGLTPDVLMAVNGLQDERIYVGQVLVVDGQIRHEVQVGETAWEIAQRYGVTLAALAGVNPDVPDLGRLQAGQVLLLPRGARPGARGSGPEPDRAVLAALARPGTFVWPAQGSISDGYGYRIHPLTGRQAFHTGIDIAADAGTPIRAARAGTVGFAGWLHGYGNTVILDHPDGTRTLYAHASRLEVREGKRVAQGEVIARVGSTGNSTGPHLHFEIIAGRPIDPEPYLP
ncbi:MAG: M23 family metallopeptidase [Bacillota bacterium]